MRVTEDTALASHTLGRLIVNRRKFAAQNDGWSWLDTALDEIGDWCTDKGIAVSRDHGVKRAVEAFTKVFGMNVCDFIEENYLDFGSPVLRAWAEPGRLQQTH